MALLGAQLVGCQRQPLLPPTPPAVAEAPSLRPPAVARPITLSAEQRAQAKTLYSQRCALCHGKAGHGDGIAAVNLRPSPRSLSDAAWQGSVQDADIAAIIVAGGAALGKSRMMPASPDLKDEPALVAGLVEIVRNFGTGQSP